MPENGLDRFYYVPHSARKTIHEELLSYTFTKTIKTHNMGIMLKYNAEIYINVCVISYEADNQLHKSLYK